MPPCGWPHCAAWLHMVHADVENATSTGPGILDHQALPGSGELEALQSGLPCVHLHSR